MPDTSDADDSPPASPPRRIKTSVDRSSLILIIIGLTAITALALAGWVLMRVSSSADSDYSDQQRAEAKTKACSAFEVVRRGVKLNTSIPVPEGSDPVIGQLAMGANARLSAYVGGLYLLDQLDPATPTDLADKMSEFADLLTAIGAYATAGASDSAPEQAARLKSADELNNQLGELCAK
ncbi:hypothetical protein [Mycolicibacterium agri]|uniref:Alanine and proline rich membrane protein n=1 Tax=Mycolicibacterium agri TaxID=36811 RepID=A0A7I9W1G6_MYCAG|nr:hypothetical protein [Mycolicibacterium agri]GFG51036.1 hypothetical protein MAGR_24770 [Mycolicibacterium agri]